MYWKCRSGLRSEDGTLDEFERKEHCHSGFFSRDGDGRIDFSAPINSLGAWWTWVRNYTTRSMTRSEDRVAAMTGMIRYFQRVTGDTPMLGLWERSFISDLYWSVDGRAEISPLTGPSWSWLFHPGQAIGSRYVRGLCELESDKCEPRLEGFDIKWTGSPFTSKLLSSTLHVSGVVRSFKIIELPWEHGLGAVPIDEPDSRLEAEAEYRMDDGSELFIGLEITCLFLSYSTDHSESDGPDGELLLESKRWEQFLIISLSRSSGLSASVPTLISDSDHTKPAAYRRLGVGSFEVQLVPEQKWAKKSDREYDNTSWPNPPLMFDGAERVTIELV